MNAPSAPLSPAIRRARLSATDGALVADWACSGGADGAGVAPGFVDLWLIDLTAAEGAASRDAWSKAAQLQLRRLLGRALEQSPETVEIVLAARGKPGLRAAGTPRLFFNTSRSGSIALVALASDAEVGVDIERHASARTPFLRAQHGLGEQEFTRRWTRHEAVVKAAGAGLSVRAQPPLAFCAAAGRVQFGGALWAWRDLPLPTDIAAHAALAYRSHGGFERCG